VGRCTVYRSVIVWTITQRVARFWVGWLVPRFFAFSDGAALVCFTFAFLPSWLRPITFVTIVIRLPILHVRLYYTRLVVLVLPHCYYQRLDAHGSLWTLHARCLPRPLLFRRPGLVTGTPRCHGAVCRCSAGLRLPFAVLPLLVRCVLTFFT